MELDQRKKQILYAVIKTYLETGEPEGFGIERPTYISLFGDGTISPSPK